MPSHTLVPSTSVTYHSLSRVMNRLHARLAPALDRAFWLRAEIGSGNERGGAFYGELVETDKGGAVIAKIRCTIWPADLQRIRMRFASAGLELELRQGAVVGLQCAVQFHSTHGISVRAIDMDPSFALGELELRRQRILKALARDGLLNRNAERSVPLLPNRILLVTSSAGAAFHDFTRALQSQPRFGFQLYLAHCFMQGPRTEESVLAALALSNRLPLDLVVLIRGGGSKLDLGWLDSDAIARCITTLSLPVWTGIGHETDTSVLDAVAAQPFRTPTAVAEALLGRFERVATRTEEARARLHSSFAAAAHSQRGRLERARSGVRLGCRQVLALRRAELTGHSHQLKAVAMARMAGARSAWLVRGHRLKQTTQSRLSVAQRRLQVCQDRMPAVVGRALERNANALRQACDRMGHLRLAERFSGERSEIEGRHAALKQTAALRIGAALVALAADAAALRSRLAARLSDERLALAPRAQSLRGAVTVRTRIASARVAATRDRLTEATGRALQRNENALTDARARLTPERVVERCARERATLAEHNRFLRANDPRVALARGFSLTYTSTGALLRSIHEIARGETVETHLADGCFEATILIVDEGTKQ